MRATAPTYSPGKPRSCSGSTTTRPPPRTSHAPIRASVPSGETLPTDTGTALRPGSRPEGIWAPECGYEPGMAPYPPA